MASKMMNSVVAFFDEPFADAVVLGFKIDGHLLVEAVLIAAIVFLLMQKSYQPEKKPLTQNEIDQLCDEWVPDPLHPPITEAMQAKVPVLESAAGPHTIVAGKDVLNLSCANYLGLVGHPRVKETCNSALNKYGVGACGPRGFYGTIDVHLDLEAKIAQFLKTPDSILYSYGLATIASVIPAFCKRGDLILADEGVHWGIQNGLYLSRSTVKLFKHNDMKHLESLLEEVFREDKRKKKALNRRFIVVEAIYQNSGLMTPLDEVIRLKEKYKFRVLVDESHSLGVLGKTGRGITEHFNLPVEKVDILTAAMGHALGSVGGFCTGSAKVVDHQRLSGAGYCFSASLPPYLASGSIAAIEIIEENPDLLVNLRRNIITFRRSLSNIQEVVVSGHNFSPLIFLHLKTPSSPDVDGLLLQEIADQMLEKESVLISVTKRSFLDKCKFPIGLRLTVSAAHTEEELHAAAGSLQRVVQIVLQQR
ncbi:serine palmitoyltransferase [Marchantia polymorpha subsp. ruderalis]|uniref:serine C-palmitoyltransferase n=1 Tax=Marchantia polymorpha TaxID=3197 RepID=A0A2R6XB09_MARPO|nr:hypothetical protein MARPO_0025s0004 [Marchantia polymorpha]BBN03841.1 hypothetical protein Mp_2g26810 [Marchantia polymorpha subsp. ruderalis]|eukprot:PTQ43293.1 hypothetical protein MARPO_0025s0004 [Marchantia polymorpha]